MSDIKFNLIILFIGALAINEVFWNHLNYLNLKESRTPTQTNVTMNIPEPIEEVLLNES